MGKWASNGGRCTFIGGGNMGGAIIRGLVSCGSLAPDRITVCCKHPDKYPAFRALGVQTADTIADAVEGADFLFLCVKPGTVREVVEECVRAPGYRANMVFISVAASVPISLICEAAGGEVPVIRTMPSTPITVGEGTVALCQNQCVPKWAFETVCRLFSSIATVSVLEESQLNAIISVNGSSPAYVYLFLKAMLDGAAEQGISAEQALPLLLRTVIGAAKMVEQADCSIEELIRRVCSPNGTTLAAMRVFDEADFTGIVSRAMDACTKRADEISASLQA